MTIVYAVLIGVLFYACMRLAGQMAQSAEEANKKRKGKR